MLIGKIARETFRMSLHASVRLPWLNLVWFCGQELESEPSHYGFISLVFFHTVVFY